MMVNKKDGIYYGEYLNGEKIGKGKEKKMY